MRSNYQEVERFVMFGQNDLFGDYVDLLHSNGCRLDRVITNVPDPTHRSYPFVERLRDYNTFLGKAGAAPAVELPLNEFQPKPGERYFMGFRQLQTLPALVTELKQRFNLNFDRLMHRTAYVSDLAELAEGIFVGAGAIVGPGVNLGPFVLLNRASSIGHDTRIGAFATAAPGAHLGGQVEIGSKAFIGIGATILPRIRVGVGAIVAGGAVVTRDVDPWTMVAGVPAKPKKELSPF